jgi:hypothetical protein
VSYFRTVFTNIWNFFSRPKKYQQAGIQDFESDNTSESESDDLDNEINDVPDRQNLPIWKPDNLSNEINYGLDQQVLLICEPDVQRVLQSYQIDVGQAIAFRRVESQNIYFDNSRRNLSKDILDILFGYLTDEELHPARQYSPDWHNAILCFMERRCEQRLENLFLFQNEILQDEVDKQREEHMAICFQHSQPRLDEVLEYPNIVKYKKYQFYCAQYFLRFGVRYDIIRAIGPEILATVPSVHGHKLLFYDRVKMEIGGEQWYCWKTHWSKTGVSFVRYNENTYSIAFSFYIKSPKYPFGDLQWLCHRPSTRINGRPQIGCKWYSQLGSSVHIEKKGLPIGVKGLSFITEKPQKDIGPEYKDGTPFFELLTQYRHSILDSKEMLHEDKEISVGDEMGSITLPKYIPPCPPNHGILIDLVGLCSKK